MQKCADHCAEYDLDPQAFVDGRRKFEFDTGIYRHRDVKDALQRAQHGKCCYCEKKVSDEKGKGDVEHYRPKAGYVQDSGERLQRPGYYWLAYEWSNLLLACANCNEILKRNRFPLANPHTRARSHHDDLGKEVPLLLNPELDDPEAHITFKEETAEAIDGDIRGKATIDVVGLNRNTLLERRREFFDIVMDVLEMAAGAPRTSQQSNAQKWLAKAQLPTEQYSSMVRAALQSATA